MNAKTYNILIIILISIIVCISAVSFFSVRHYKSELGFLRNQLESARNRESDITDTIERYAIRTSRIFGESYDSITAIREAVTELEEEYNNLILRIRSVSSDEFYIDCEY